MGIVKTESGFYYRTRWDEDQLFCPLGRVYVRPHVRVWTVDCEIIPFREINKMMKDIPVATYEDAARRLAQMIHEAYGGKLIKVRVGEQGLWGQFVIKEGSKNGTR